jgi:hypothetical protein
MKFDHCKVTELERLGLRSWQATIVDDSCIVPLAHLRLIKKFTRKGAEEEAELICFVLNTNPFVWQ